MCYCILNKKIEASGAGGDESLVGKIVDTLSDTCSLKQVVAFRQHYSGIEARVIFFSRFQSQGSRAPKTCVNNSKLQIRMVTKVKSGSLQCYPVHV